MRYSKYNAKKVEIDKENGIAYVADFKYFDKAKGRTVVEDVKGYKTDVYKIKRKLFLSMYCKDDILFIES